MIASRAKLNGDIGPVSCVVRRRLSLELGIGATGLRLRIALVALLAAGVALPQDQPDPGARDQQEPSYEAPPIVGRPDAFSTYARASGANGFAPETPTPSEDQAPPVLTQTTGISDQTKGALRTFGLYGQIVGVYDSGLVAPTVTSGKPASAIASYGEETDFGANAARRWRRGKFTVEYRGAYRHYANAPSFDGLDQFLQLTYREALARHLTLDAKSTIGSTTLAGSGFGLFPTTTLERAGLPTDELFDSRTNYMQSRVDLTWQLTARLSVEFGGDGFVVRRESPLLAGLNGYDGRASVAYRLTRRQTVSAIYEDTYFNFQNAFGNARLQTAALGYSIALAREWDLSTLGGGVRVGMLGLTQVAIDPAIAALIGESFAIVTFHNGVYLPVAEIRLVRRLKNGSLSFEYSDSVTPGNGLYLTSRQTSGVIAYSYAASRNLQARVNAGYGELSALGQDLGAYSNVQGGVQILYRLTGETFLDARYEYRHFTTGDAVWVRDANRFSLGIAFSLGETSPVAW